MSVPTVSVVVPVYNGAQYVKEALESLCRQSLTDIEILVVDDASTDQTRDVVAGLLDERIRLIRHERNRGPAEARNTGIREARGRFIAMQDGDDVSEVTRLSEQVQAMERDESLIYVGCWGTYIDAHSKPTGTHIQMECESDQLAVLLLFRNRIMGSSAMMRRDTLPAGLYAGSIPLAEDYYFAVAMSTLGRVGNVPKHLLRVRRDGTSLTYRKQALMTECVSRVHRMQLESLGLVPSLRDLEIHQNIGRHMLPSSASVLRESESWLRRLKDVNCVAGRYDKNLFDELVGREWFDLCCYSSGIGLQAWRLYERSALSRYLQVESKLQIKFLVKCLLKHQRAAGDVPRLPPTG